jgi:hypothetical protein
VLPATLPLVVPPLKELAVLEKLLIDGRTENPVPLDPASELPRALPAVPLTMLPDSVPALVPEVPVPLLVLVPPILEPFAVSEVFWARPDCTVSPKGLVKPLVIGSGDDDGEKKPVVMVCDKPLVIGMACVEEKKGEG